MKIVVLYFCFFYFSSLCSAPIKMEHLQLMLDVGYCCCCLSVALAQILDSIIIYYEFEYKMCSRFA